MKITIPKVKMSKKKPKFWVAIISTTMAGMSIFYSLYQLYMPFKIIVPNKDIEAKQLIKAEDLKVTSISKRDLLPKTVINPNQIVGKYANTKLYKDEQIIGDRLTDMPGAITGAFSLLAPNETYVTFQAGEAKWPKGIKKGDTVSVLAITDTDHVMVAQRIKVISTEEPSSMLDPLKQNMQSSSESITIGGDFSIISQILDRKVKSKLLYLLPEHPNMPVQQAQVVGGELDEQRPENTNQGN